MRSRLVAVAVGGIYLSLACGGCVSNEYVIAKRELTRLAGLPASQRGARVHVVQELGSSDEWAGDNGDAVPDEAYANEFAVYDQPEDVVDVVTNLDFHRRAEPCAANQALAPVLGGRACREKSREAPARAAAAAAAAAAAI
jgi:hypothetical protein